MRAGSSLQTGPDSWECVQEQLQIEAGAEAHGGVPAG